MKIWLVSFNQPNLDNFQYYPKGRKVRLLFLPVWIGVVNQSDQSLFFTRRTRVQTWRQDLKNIVRWWWCIVMVSTDGTSLHSYKVLVLSTSLGTIVIFRSICFQNMRDDRFLQKMQGYGLWDNWLTWKLRQRMNASFNYPPANRNLKNWIQVFWYFWS